MPKAKVQLRFGFLQLWVKWHKKGGLSIGGNRAFEIVGKRPVPINWYNYGGKCYNWKIEIFEKVQKNWGECALNNLPLHGPHKIKQFRQSSIVMVALWSNRINVEFCLGGWRIFKSGKGTLKEGITYGASLNLECISGQLARLLHAGFPLNATP
jgi:hypothetical protein